MRQGLTKSDGKRRNFKVIKNLDSSAAETRELRDRTVSNAMITRNDKMRQG